MRLIERQLTRAVSQKRGLMAKVLRMPCRRFVQNAGRLQRVLGAGVLAAYNDRLIDSIRSNLRLLEAIYSELAPPDSSGSPTTVDPYPDLSASIAAVRRKLEFIEARLAELRSAAATYSRQGIPFGTD